MPTPPCLVAEQLWLPYAHLSLWGRTGTVLTRTLAPVGLGLRQVDWNELEMSRMPTGTLDLAPEKPT